MQSCLLESRDLIKRKVWIVCEPETISVAKLLKLSDETRRDKRSDTGTGKVVFGKRTNKCVDRIDIVVDRFERCLDFCVRCDFRERLVLQ